MENENEFNLNIGIKIVFMSLSMIVFLGGEGGSSPGLRLLSQGPGMQRRRDCRFRM